VLGRVPSPKPRERQAKKVWPAAHLFHDHDRLDVAAAAGIIAAGVVASCQKWMVCDGVLVC
jgi:hypothetical protein